MCTSALFLWTVSTCHFAWVNAFSFAPLPPPPALPPPPPPYPLNPLYWPDFVRDPKCVIVAPKVLRVGIEENILLEAFGLSEPVDVKIRVYKYPLRTPQQLFQKNVTLNSHNNYSVLTTITIPRRNLWQEQTDPTDVLLLATFGNFRQVDFISKVSFLSGYIFIQTDKPIYNPGDTVRFRAFISNPEFQAFNSTISVEIQNSDETTVHAISEVSATDGIFSDTHALSDIVKEGKWKIVAKFDNLKENTYSANFEVKKYELPAFNVTLVPKNYHLSLEDTELEVKVYAKYVYGENVDGVAYVVFGIEKDGLRTRLSPMKQVKNLDGGTATMTVAELKKAYPDINHVDGLSLYIKASVMTSTGSDLVEAEKSGIKIVLAPYVLAIKDTSRFYKLGLPYDFTVTVSHHDGSPAPNVPVKISLLSAPVTKHSGTIRVSLNMPCGFGPKTIRVKTVVPDLKPEQQAKTEWLAEVFAPSSFLDPNQLYITVDKKTVKVGETLDFQLQLSLSLEQYNIGQASYTVLNKGKIIRAGKANITEDQVTNVSLLVTSEMVPAFRFVVYSILSLPYKVEVVADSILVNVESHCLGSLKVESFGGEAKDSYSPGDSFSFQVRGDPGARVSLVAVDNSVFLLSKSRLTQKKIWDTLGQGDLGCSSGGGRNSMSMFVDAGLSFHSSFRESTANTFPPCYWNIRRRRSVEKLLLRDQLEKSYSDQLLQRCCSDGMREIPMPYSCRRRALYITEGWSCVLAFLQCCSKYRGEELGVITSPEPTTPEPTLPTWSYAFPAQYGPGGPQVLFGIGEMPNISSPFFHGIPSERGDPHLPGPVSVPGPGSGGALGYLTGGDVGVPAGDVGIPAGRFEVLAGGFGVPAADGFGVPAAGRFGVPAGGGFGVPAGGGFGVPAAGGFGVPAGGGFGVPAGGVGVPAAGGFGVPAADGFGVPTGGGFGVPAAGRFGVPAGGVGVPAAGRFGVPAGGGFGVPAAGGFGGVPAAGGFGGVPAAGGFGGVPAAGGIGGVPAAGGFGGVPAAGGFGGVPAAGGFGGVPAAGGFGGVLGAGGFGGVPAAGGVGVPAAGGFGGVPAAGGFGGVLGAGGFGGVPAAGGVGVPAAGGFGVPAGGFGLGASGSGGLASGISRIPISSLSYEYYEKLDDIYVRNKFFESWLWTDVQLPGAPGPDGLAVAPVESVLPDSITQWGILAISASSSTGFCVAEPFNIRAWKPFFINLRLPRTAARNEHVEVKAVLHNYMSKDLKVLVVLAKTEDMCSVAFTEDHKQEVLVRAYSSVLIPYTVIPLRAGELHLQVTAVSRSFTGRDAIRKTLRVVVEGIQKMDVRSFVLNPAEKGDINGKQLIRVNKAVLRSVVPNSFPETFVNVRGSLLADSIDNSINDDSLAALIQMPGGCVEQNLASITLPLIAAHYLDRSSEWDSVGIQRREDAISYIKKGYENQLHYRKSDDSYPPYRNEGTSTWITAFVVKVFSMAHPFITVDKQHICGPLSYLLKHKQLPSGAFKEDNPVYTTFLTGGLQGAESRETLTAFVLIALAEAQSAVTCSDPEVVPRVSLTRAEYYLTARYRHLRRPYSVAIVSYALALSSQGCSKSVLLESASPDRTHWPDADNHFFTMEATGYALLALLKCGHVQEAAAPFKWLNQQRRAGGGFGSTQSTMIVLQALSEYLVKKPPPADMNLKVVLSVPGSSDTHWNFTKQLAHVARSSKVPIDKDFTVVASGNGQGILEVVTVYNELPDAHDNGSCNGFELNVSISESTEKPPAEVEKVYKLSISVRALARHQVRMAVLDISLPTGFEPENADLELLTNSVDRYINNFQIVDNLSDRGSLIIHLFKVSSKEADVIVFRMNQKFKVGLLQPSTVTVYQYYNTDKRCGRFYTPPEDREELGQICKDDVCRCAQGDCCVLKTGARTVAARKKAACSGIHHVFKVRVLSVTMSQYDRYELEVLQVIKEGSEIGVKEKDTRVFLSHGGCRAGLNLLTGQDFLIIGPSSDVWDAGSDKNGYTYTLGKNTWVERWPSGACDKCAGLNDFSAELLNTGCRT